MEFLRQEEEREVDECGTGRKRDGVLTRFFRKKYKCIMMFLCIIALIFQTAYLVIEKTDSQNLNLIMSNMPNITKKIMSLFKSFDQNLTEPNLHATHSSNEQPEYG